VCAVRCMGGGGLVVGFDRLSAREVVSIPMCLNRHDVCVWLHVIELGE
jgi:hypothetical protein